MALYNAALFLVLFLSLFMMLLVGGRRRMRGAVPMLVLLSGMSIWTLCQLLHIYVIDPQAKYFWYQAKFVGIVMVPAAFVVLAAVMSLPGKPVKPWFMAGMLGVSAMTWAAILTDPWLHLFRRKIEYVFVEQFILIRTQDGPAFWAFTGYSYLLIGISIVLLMIKARHSEGSDRHQALLMLFGSIFPWVWNIGFVLLSDQSIPLDLTPVFMLVTEIVFLITLFYYRMFSIVPYTKRAVFDRLQDLVVAVDSGGIIQDMNPAAQVVFKAGEEALGQKIAPLLTRLDPIPKPDLEGLQGEYRGRYGDRLRDYMARTAPIAGKNGEAVGTLMVFQDITELADARRTLEMATRELALQNEKKMRFANQVNRNIRIPMNRVLGYAGILQQDALDPGSVEAIEHLTLSGGHLMRLINDITDFSRLEAGSIELSEGPVHLYDLVRHVCRLHEYSAGQKGIRVQCRINPDVPPIVLSDSLRLTQVLSNIVGNAVKFTNEGAISVVLSRLDDQWMEISVSDTGVGISEEELPGIFEPYQQAGEGSYRFSGTGLGLAIVQELTVRMGGRVTVESRLGEGTTFRLTLPCHESPATSPVYDLQQIDGYRRRALNVAILARDPVLQRLIRRFFDSWENARCRILAEASVDPAHESPWDVLLVDLDHLPDTVTSALLKDRSGAQHPVVIGMTYDTDTLIREQQGRGISDECLLLPFSVSGLHGILRRQLLQNN